MRTIAQGREYVSQAIRNQQVSGSSPLAGSNKINNLRGSRLVMQQPRVTIVSRSDGGSTTRRNRAIQRVQADPASRRLRRLDAPPAGDVALVVRMHAELVGNRTGDLVVDRADGRHGLRVHGREGVDDRYSGAIAVVQRVADAGLRQAERRWSRDGFPCSRRHVGRRRSEPENDGNSHRSELRSRLRTCSSQP